MKKRAKAEWKPPEGYYWTGNQWRPIRPEPVVNIEATDGDESEATTPPQYCLICLNEVTAEEGGTLTKRGPVCLGCLNQHLAGEKPEWMKAVLRPDHGNRPCEICGKKVDRIDYRAESYVCSRCIALGAFTVTNEDEEDEDEMVFDKPQQNRKEMENGKLHLRVERLSERRGSSRITQA